MKKARFDRAAYHNQQPLNEQLPGRSSTVTYPNKRRIEPEYLPSDSCIRLILELFVDRIEINRKWIAPPRSRYLRLTHGSEVIDEDSAPSL